jgi:hypothetical protein
MASAAKRRKISIAGRNGTVPLSYAIG